MTWDDDDLLRKHPQLERILIRSDEIHKRVRQLGNEISRDYADNVPVLVSILKGSYVFLADLTRCLTIPHEVDFMAISSYHGGTQSTGVVKIEKDLKTNITGRDVLIVEDIVDTGLTISYLLDLLGTRSPRSLRVCTLLDKTHARTKEVAVAYGGFEIPSEFVIGYGLDYDEKFRNLPFIGVMRG
ncbi:MAG: hypoxanthine phosphoribosyltransferase [Candidatus Krumholzibacteriia bacterium]